MLENAFHTHSARTFHQQNISGLRNGKNCSGNRGVIGKNFGVRNPSVSSGPDNSRSTVTEGKHMVKAEGAGQGTDFPVQPVGIGAQFQHIPQRGDPGVTLGTLREPVQGRCHAGGAGVVEIVDDVERSDFQAFETRGIGAYLSQGRFEIRDAVLQGNGDGKQDIAGMCAAAGW